MSTPDDRYSLTEEELAKLREMITRAGYGTVLASISHLFVHEEPTTATTAPVASFAFILGSAQSMGDKFDRARRLRRSQEGNDG